MSPTPRSGARLAKGARLRDQTPMARDGFLMMDLLRGLYWIDEALQRGLRAHGWSDVSRSQSLILVNIASGVHRASQLAVNLGVSRQAISQMLSEMQKGGLVELAPDPTDGRAQRVSFSRGSAKLRDDALDILQSIEAELAKRVGKRRMTALRDVLAVDWGALPAFEVAAASNEA
jgi:DNA-binding MarR family transcriptional regulator